MYILGIYWVYIRYMFWTVHVFVCDHCMFTVSDPVYVDVCCGCGQDIFALRYSFRICQVCSYKTDWHKMCQLVQQLEVLSSD